MVTVQLEVMLQRGLSARQVQMIAVAGTIGTGLFLGTGRSLAEGGPASILVCYGIIGFIVYITLLLLGEMATQYPVAGSFNAYTTRFFSPSYGFALAWNYWFNDAVSLASDLTAAQLVIQFWTSRNPWPFSLLAWLILVSINALHVRAYGELGSPLLSSPSLLSPRIRILARLPQGRHHHHIHHPRHTRQRRRKHRSYLHRHPLLVHPRRSLCQWFLRLCSRLCHRELCMHVHSSSLLIPSLAHPPSSRRNRKSRHHRR